MCVAPACLLQSQPNRVHLTHARQLHLPAPCLPCPSQWHVGAIPPANLTHPPTPPRLALRRACCPPPPTPQWHVEDFLLQSINLMLVGQPKAWWWMPRSVEAQAKEFLGREHERRRCGAGGWRWRVGAGVGAGRGGAGRAVDGKRMWQADLASGFGKRIWRADLVRVRRGWDWGLERRRGGPADGRKGGAGRTEALFEVRVCVYVWWWWGAKAAAMHGTRRMEVATGLGWWWVYGAPQRACVHPLVLQAGQLRATQLPLPRVQAQGGGGVGWPSVVAWWRCPPPPPTPGPYRNTPPASPTHNPTSPHPTPPQAVRLHRGVCPQHPTRPAPLPCTPYPKLPNPRLYAKAVPLAEVPMEDVLRLGARRSVQLPGVVFVTAPGYAFHTTLSAGWSLADSANFLTNVRGKVRTDCRDGWCLSGGVCVVSWPANLPGGRTQLARSSVCDGGRSCTRTQPAQRGGMHVPARACVCHCQLLTHASSLLPPPDILRAFSVC